MCGLLTAGNEALIPYALRLYKSNDPCKFEIAAGFKSTFSVPCKPYFLGLWDTLSSVGWILDPIHTKGGHLPYTATLPDVPVIRHAVSIDERRAFFRQNLVHEPAAANQNVKQVWFAGVHSDVGGSYAEAESGLSKIALRWMLCEAESAGLGLDPEKVVAVPAGRYRTSRRIPRGSCINRCTDSGGSEKSGRSFTTTTLLRRGKSLTGSAGSGSTWGVPGRFQTASISTRAFSIGHATSRSIGRRICHSNTSPNRKMPAN